jgi:hypothetical protein
MNFSKKLFKQKRLSNRIRRTQKYIPSQRGCQCVKKLKNKVKYMHGNKSNIFRQAWGNLK